MAVDGLGPVERYLSRIVTSAQPNDLIEFDYTNLLLLRRSVKIFLLGV